jgi:hypothetical protein
MVTKKKEAKLTLIEKRKQKQAKRAARAQADVKRGEMTRVS